MCRGQEVQMEQTMTPKEEDKDLKIREFVWKIRYSNCMS